MSNYMTIQPLSDEKKALFLLSCASDLMDDYIALMKSIKQDSAYIEDVVNLQTEIDSLICNASTPFDVLCEPQKYWPEIES